METSKWEGTKEPVMIIYNDYSSSYYMKSNQVFDDETLEEGNANARLFTDALHTIQECGMMPSELREEASKYELRCIDLDSELEFRTQERNLLEQENVTLKQSISELSQRSEDVARIANHHAEENAKLKAIIEKLKNTPEYQNWLKTLL